MRDDLDLAYDYDRPSRISRVVILLSTLAVAGIAIWVFTPLLLANYNAYTARTTLPKTAPAEAPRVVAAIAPVAPAAAAAPAAAPTSDTTAAARADEPAMPPAIPPALRNLGTRSLNAWPNPPAYAPNDTPTTSAIAPRAEPPAPRRDANMARTEANTIQLAAVSAAAPVETADVPLPRARPSRLIAARLAIPLPRPRPDIPEEAPAAPSAFDLQVERMR
jgi:hypothetical protein